MNELSVPQDAGMTMSTRLIAEQIDKEHHHVMRDTRRMLRDIGASEGSVPTSEYQAENGKHYSEYHLDFDLTLTLVSGYSAKLRYAVVKRWRELEQANQQPTLDMTPTYKASDLIKATGHRNSPGVMAEAGYMRHLYPQAVKKLTGDYLLAPFLAYQFATTLLRKMEETHEKLVRQEKTSDKQWERIVKGKEAIRQMFKEDPSVKQLTAYVPNRHQLA